MCRSYILNVGPAVERTLPRWAPVRREPVPRARSSTRAPGPAPALCWTWAVRQPVEGDGAQMMTEHRVPTLFDPSDDGGPITASRLVTFLFELHRALALPPSEVTPPPDVVQPTIHPEHELILTAD